MKPISILRSKTVVMAAANIDTDQIIPARFLTITTKDGLGTHAFADWRYDVSGNPDPGFILNQSQAQGCSILVAGANFGCGSSREHAPWALLDYGIRAVISCEIADIFKSNSLKNGLLPLEVDQQTHAWLLSNAGADVTIDLASKSLTLPTGKSTHFPMEAFACYCLLTGVDELGYLLAQSAQIDRYESGIGR